MSMRWQHGSVFIFMLMPQLSRISGREMLNLQRVLPAHLGSIFLLQALPLKPLFPQSASASPDAKRVHLIVLCISEDSSQDLPDEAKSAQHEHEDRAGHGPVTIELHAAVFNKHLPLQVYMNLKRRNCSTT